MDHSHHDHSAHQAAAAAAAASSQSMDSSHSAHGSSGMSHGSMAMVWNWNTNTAILFDFWQTNGIETMLVSCFIVFGFCVGHEYFQSQRLNFEKRLLAPSSSTDQQQLIRAIIHSISSFSSLLIMTIFMSLNGYLVIAVILGTGVGFYLFRKGAIVGGKGGMVEMDALQCH
ncbi:hypothetical protein HDU76_002679 [Blyttiomyces sp. JEL0837]|nr:hypothetical protein HDU76_002679 [Blyttiomyces sp. JEL0837]